MPHLDTEVDSLFFFFSSDEEYEEEEEEEEYEEEVQTNPDEYEILFFCPQPVSEIYQTNPPIYMQQIHMRSFSAHSLYHQYI